MNDIVLVTELIITLFTNPFNQVDTIWLDDYRLSIGSVSNTKAYGNNTTGIVCGSHVPHRISLLITLQCSLPNGL